MQYKRVAIPKPLFDRFEKIQPILGYRTFSEFVISKIREDLMLEEGKAESIMDKKIEERREQTEW